MISLYILIKNYVHFAYILVHDYVHIKWYLYTYWLKIMCKLRSEFIFQQVIFQQLCYSFHPTLLGSYSTNKIFSCSFHKQSCSLIVAGSKLARILVTRLKCPSIIGVKSHFVPKEDIPIFYTSFVENQVNCVILPFCGYNWKVFCI